MYNQVFRTQVNYSFKSSIPGFSSIKIAYSINNTLLIYTKPVNIYIKRYTGLNYLDFLSIPKIPTKYQKRLIKKSLSNHYISKLINTCRNSSSTVSSNEFLSCRYFYNYSRLFLYILIKPNLYFSNSIALSSYRIFK